MIGRIKKLFQINNIAENYPIMKLGFRGEDIEYILETDFADIGSTHINGRRLYADFTKWRSGKLITPFDKEIIFKNCLEYILENNSIKTIVVINKNIDKDFWDSMANKYCELIKNVEYESNESKDTFLLEQLIQSIRGGGNVEIDNINFNDEKAFISYWHNRKSK